MALYPPILPLTVSTNFTALRCSMLLHQNEVGLALAKGDEVLDHLPRHAAQIRGQAALRALCIPPAPIF
jgi:hypothetical protein